jgi:chromosome segregation ATPase
MPPNHPYGCGPDCDLYYAVVKSPDYAVRIIQAARAKEDLLDESIARENTLRARVAELEEGRAQERIAHEATIRDCQSLRDRLRVAEKDAAEYLDGREMYRRDLGRANAEIARLREALETIRAGLADDRAYRDTARAALDRK